MTENISNKTLTVGTDQVEVSPDMTGSQRSFIGITNTSTGGQIISLSFGQEAVSLSGTVIYPGGKYSESTDAGYKPTNKQITAISNLAGGTIAIQERIFVRSF